MRASSIWVTIDNFPYTHIFRDLASVHGRRPPFSNSQSHSLIFRRSLKRKDVGSRSRPLPLFPIEVEVAEVLEEIFQIKVNHKKLRDLQIQLLRTQCTAAPSNLSIKKSYFTCRSRSYSPRGSRSGGAGPSRRSPGRGRTSHRHALRNQFQIVIECTKWWIYLPDYDCRELPFRLLKI